MDEQNDATNKDPLHGFCNICGRTVFLPFTCRYCNLTFCDEHRLPENHSCIKMPPRSWEKYRELKESPIGFLKSGKDEELVEKAKDLPSKRNFRMHTYVARARRVLKVAVRTIGLILFISLVLLPNVVLYAFVETELETRVSRLNYLLLLLGMDINPAIGLRFLLGQYTVVTSLLQLSAMLSVVVLLIQKIRRRTNKWYYILAIGISLANWLLLMRSINLLEFLVSLFSKS